VAYGFVLGTTTGLFSVAGRIVWAQYFGRRHLAGIAGIASTLGVLGSALGPMPFGIMRDLAGSYSMVLIVSAVVSLLMAAAVLTARKPQRAAINQARST
jgi:cyanate permease